MNWLLLGQVVAAGIGGAIFLGVLIGLLGWFAGVTMDALFWLSDRIARRCKR